MVDQQHVGLSHETWRRYISLQRATETERRSRRAILTIGAAAALLGSPTERERARG